VASIGASRSGELYNVNADTFAAHLAGIIGAQRLVIAGSTSGVLDEAGHTIPALDLDGIERLVTAGTATAGMIAKLSAARDAVVNGVREVLIVNGGNLGALTQLVRQGTRAAVSGYTQVKRKGPVDVRLKPDATTPRGRASRVPRSRDSRSARL